MGQYTYSNAGYVVVGAIMEAHTGKSWEQLITERLFAPLGMDRCGFGPTPDGYAVGHDSSGTPRPGLDNPPILGPAGTVHCDLNSWSKFVAANLSGEPSLLPPALWNQLHEPQVGNYALGWVVTERGWADGLTLVHTGSNTLWYAVVWAAPNIDRAFVAITNTTAPNANSVSSVLDTLISNMIQHDANNTVVAFDFGDAPPSYPVTMAQDGARHASNGATLGMRRDVESDGHPSLDATGDALV